MSQRFVTPSANNSCLEQEYTYASPDNEVGAVIIYALVVRFHIRDHHIRRDHWMKSDRPIGTRRDWGQQTGRANNASGVRGSWYDDSQGQGQCNNGNKSSSGGGVHGASKSFCTNGAY